MNGQTIISKGKSEFNEKQNINYVNMQAQVLKKRTERLQEGLHMLEGEKSNTIIKFCTSKREIKRLAKEQEETTKIPQTTSLDEGLEKYLTQKKKQQYKKYADNLDKQKTLMKISSALG